MRDESKTKVIEKDAITKLCPEHARRIHATELRYDVKASIQRRMGRIVIIGQKGDILNAMEEIYTLLNQV